MALRYFKSGATVWNLAASWSSTSSSGVDNAGVPGTSDDVYFDSNSGNCTVNVTANCLTINFTGYAGTITMSNTISIASGGTLTVGATSVNVSGSSNLISNSNTTISASGGSWGGNMSFTGTGTRTLLGNFSIGGLLTCPSIGQTITLSGAFNLRCQGLTHNGGIVGNSTLILTGGTWTGSATTPISTNLHFDGDVIFSSNVNWSPTVANGTATIKYLSGTLNTGTSTLTISLTSTSGITIFDAAGINFYNITLNNSGGASNSIITLISDLTATGTVTFTNTTGIPTFTLEGSATINSPSATLNVAVTGIIFNFTNEVVAGSLTKPTNGSFNLSSGSILRLNGNLPVGSGIIAGTGLLRLGGGGVWTWTSNPGTVRCSVEFVGDYTISGSVRWDVTAANGAATMKYVSGIITTSGSTLTSNILSTNGIGTFDMAGMSFNNLTLEQSTNANAILTLTSDLSATGTLSISASQTSTLTFSGGGSINQTGTFIPTNGIYTISTSNPITVGGLNRSGASTSSLTLNTGVFTINGNLQLGNGPILGTTNINLGGGGTWSATASGGIVRTNVEFVGNYTISGNVYWAPTVANGAATLKYTSGTITTTGSTLTVSLNSTANNINFDCNGMSWNNITWAISNSTTHTPNFVSNLVWSGTLTHSGSTFVSVVITPSGTAGLAGTGTLQITGPITWNLNSNWSCGNFTYQSSSATATNLTLNNNSLSVTGNLTIGAHTNSNSLMLGTTTIRLTGTGTWSSVSPFRNNCTIDTIGTITLGSTVTYNTGTLTYTAGTVNNVSNLSTFTVTAATTFENLTGFPFYNLTINNVAITINTTGLVVDNTLTLLGNTSFTGSSTTGWTCKNLSVSVISSNMTHTLKSATTYNVGTITPGQLTLLGTVSNTINWLSSVSSTYAIFNLGSLSNQLVRYVTATDINSSGGLTIRNRYGTLTRTLNWSITNKTRCRTWVDQQE